ncbi:sensor histidine kinase [Amycolatopsis nigrescens]|uniref:sensor histidine kinase n=1 Tax=Amycolatopsis nigrescens TaxID=381445 RepID=UPI00036C8E75|nr:histidine kinase [Amycolatopsis nigrescens]
MPALNLPSVLNFRRLGPWQQDIVIGVGTFVAGCLLYSTGLYPLFSSPDELAWWRFAIFGGICVAEVFRRHRPGAALAAAAVLLGVDVANGLSAPTLVAFSDLLYAATLYGSRRLSTAMVPAAAMTTIGAVVVALLIAPDWRAGVVAAVAALPLVVVPVWWATNVRQHKMIADNERANAANLARIGELDRNAAVAEERARMARDLHDVIAGHLSAIAIQSEAVLSINDADPATARRVLGSVRENSVQALEEMRAMIGLLRSEENRAGGDGGDETTAPARLAELSKLVDSARASGMRVEVSSELDESVPLPAAVDLTAYRIAQEALTNAVKHAPGTHAKVSIRHSGEILTIEVANELKAGTAEAGEDTGRGLLNMRERAMAVGGSLSAGPSEAGWLVRAVLPISGLGT